MARKPTIEELEEKRRQLDARIREMRAREEKAERDARNKFHHVLAGDVESVLGDWRRIDLEGFHDWLWGMRDQARASAVLGRGRTADEALRAAREHERARQSAARERAREKRGAAAGKAVDA